MSHDPGFADKELLEQVQRCGDKAESIENEALEYLSTGHMLLGMGAQEQVNFLNKADRVDDAGDDAEVVEILDLDFRRRLAHPTNNTSAAYPTYGTPEIRQSLTPIHHAPLTVRCPYEHRLTIAAQMTFNDQNNNNNWNPGGGILLFGLIAVFFEFVQKLFASIGSVWNWFYFLPTPDNIAKSVSATHPIDVCAIWFYWFTFLKPINLFTNSFPVIWYGVFSLKSYLSTGYPNLNVLIDVLLLVAALLTTVLFIVVFFGTLSAACTLGVLVIGQLLKLLSRNPESNDDRDTQLFTFLFLLPGLMCGLLHVYLWLLYKP